MRFADVLEAYALSLRARGRSPRTVDAYVRDVSKLKALGKPLGSIRAHHLERLLADCTNQSTRNRMIASFKSFFDWVHRRGLVGSNPAAELSGRTVRRTPRVVLSPEEVERVRVLLESCADWLSVRDAAIVQMLWGVGLRVSELVGLDVGDVDLDGCRLFVRAKGDRRQVKVFGERARRALERWLSVRAQHDGHIDALFISQKRTRMTARQVQNILKRRFAEAGVDKPVHPHALRHSFATELLRRTGNLRLVQKALGHASVTSTQVYTHILAEDVRDAVADL